MKMKIINQQTAELKNNWKNQIEKMGGGKASQCCEPRTYCASIGSKDYPNT